VALGSVLVLTVVGPESAAQSTTQPKRPTVTTQPVAPRPPIRVAPDLPVMPDLDALDFVSTDSGLRYHDYEPGTDVEVGEKGFVEFRFAAWLEDGKYWQGTPERAPSRKLPVSGTGFRGWSEGVASMKVGGRRLLVIPPDLGFGERGMPGLPPNSTIVMDVSVLDYIYTKPTPTDPEDETKTPSGLRYVDLRLGKGETPEPRARVKVEYAGWVEDGRMFSGSAVNGEPTVIELGRVIPGWTEGVGSMKLGGRRKLIIPPELGYGERGGRGIPPNATLTFEVELLEILPPVARGPDPRRTSPPKRPTTRPAPVPPKPAAPPKKGFEGMPELPQ
jgi:peptidylprolyl isomerase